MTKEKFRPSWYEPAGAIKHLDLFAQPVPGFSVRGLSSIPSLLGGIFSFFIICIITLYATIKGTHLMMRHSPIIG